MISHYFASPDGAIEIQCPCIREGNCIVRIVTNNDKKVEFTHDIKEEFSFSGEDFWDYFSGTPDYKEKRDKFE